VATINKVIERVGRVRPDAYDDGTKAAWLLELEGRLRREVIGRHEPLAGEVLPEAPESYPEDGDKPLLVGAPWDRLYDLYLMAQVDFYNREMSNYNNSVTAFNDALDQWRQSYHRRHMPLDRGGYRNVM